jgi:hypothetical protein
MYYRIFIIIISDGTLSSSFDKMCSMGFLPRKNLNKLYYYYRICFQTRFISHPKER